MRIELSTYLPWLTHDPPTPQLYKLYFQELNSIQFNSSKLLMIPPVSRLEKTLSVCYFDYKLVFFFPEETSNDRWSCSRKPSLWRRPSWRWRTCSRWRTRRRRSSRCRSAGGSIGPSARHPALPSSHAKHTRHLPSEIGLTTLFSFKFTFEKFFVT